MKKNNSPFVLFNFLFVLVIFVNGGAFAATAADCGANEYLDSTNECRTCPAKANGVDWSDNVFVGDARIIECGNGVFKCRTWSFRVLSGSEYACAQCPTISNHGDFDGISKNNSSAHVAPVTWSSTERCTFSYTYTDANGCSGTRDYAALASNGCYHGNKSLPESEWTFNNMDEGHGIKSCDYAPVKASYTYAPINYGVSYNNTANAVCNTCGDNQYSVDGSLNCSTVPLHADKSADGGSFVCKPGAYKSGNSCYGCPMSTDWNGPGTLYMTSNAGATSVNQCFIKVNDEPVGASGPVSGNDGTGTWELSSDCYYTGSAYKISLNWASNVSDSCPGAIEDFCSSYFGATGSEKTACKNAILAGWNTRDIWAFHDFFETVVYSHECNSDLQGVFTYTD